MNISEGHTITEKKYSSLSRSIILWFLLLSTLPLSIVSYIGYQQTTIALKDDVSKNLKQASTLSIGFIQNWFEYRLMDISIQAESSENIKLLQSLKNGLKQSGKPLKDYVKSFDWTLRTDGLQDNLISLSRRYDYIYDLFLLDTEGNLLFTVAHELDFGTNMLSGIYSNTLFSNSIKRHSKAGRFIFLTWKDMLHQMIFLLVL